MSNNHDSLPVSAEDLDKLRKIHSLMAQANQLFESLPLEVRDRALDTHSENHSLNHCVRWGEHTGRELVRMAEETYSQSPIAKSQARRPR